MNKIEIVEGAKFVLEITPEGEDPTKVELSLDELSALYFQIGMKLNFPTNPALPIVPYNPPISPWDHPYQPHPYQGPTCSTLPHNED